MASHGDVYDADAVVVSSIKPEMVADIKRHFNITPDPRAIRSNSLVDQSLIRVRVVLSDIKMYVTVCTVVTFLSIALLSSTTLATTLPTFLSHRHPDVGQSYIPPPPKPEPIVVTELPLPPVAPTDEVGSCSPKINPHRTGCINQTPTLLNGNFLPDGNHVLASLNYTGAPASPSPASIYTGLQLIIVKADGTKFPNGDPWKCLTCGVPAANQVGRSDTVDYPQAFYDGKRALFGTNIIDCSPYQLASPDCTANKAHIYPIRWNVQPDGSGSSGPMRELRIHPDNVHLGYSSQSFSGGQLAQFSYFGRLQFNPSPTTGIPLAPRYDLINVTRLHSPDKSQSVLFDGGIITINNDALTVGELRGFSGTGHEVTYLGYPWESCNIDVFAADLTTGKIRRLTSHPEYVDPVDISRDDKWTVVMDTRGSGRQMFIAGMRHVPPLIDLIVTGITSSTRNNGNRRFFQPYIIDYYGDRGDYFGQQVNAGDKSPGSISDPLWNGRADPKWSPDGTRIAYFQAYTVYPECGGINPLPCGNSTAQGGRTDRLMLAHFPSRKPVKLPPVAPISDTVPWGVPYVPGGSVPTQLSPSPGNYTLKGQVSGYANVSLIANNSTSVIETVGVTYHGYSDDGINILNGAEQVTVTSVGLTILHADWYSNLTSTGDETSTKITSPDGFHITMDIMTNIFMANGTLTTTVDGVVYKQPANGT